MAFRTELGLASRPPSARCLAEVAIAAAFPMASTLSSSHAFIAAALFVDIAHLCCELASAGAS